MIRTQEYKRRSRCDVFDHNVRLHPMVSSELGVVQLNTIEFVQVVAISKERAIGSKNQIPWHEPEDLKHFKALTKGHVIVMGRKTFESFGGRFLPDRFHVIVTRDPAWSPLGLSPSSLHTTETRKTVPSPNQPPEQYPLRSGDNFWVVPDLDSALESANQEAQARGQNRVFVIGGAEIYRQTLPICTSVYITEVDIQVPDADAFYPELPPEFILVEDRLGSKPQLHFKTYSKANRQGRAL